MPSEVIEFTRHWRRHHLSQIHQVLVPGPHSVIARIEVDSLRALRTLPDGAVAKLIQGMVARQAQRERLEDVGEVSLVEGATCVLRLVYSRGLSTPQPYEQKDAQPCGWLSEGRVHQPHGSLRQGRLRSAVDQRQGPRHRSQQLEGGSGASSIPSHDLSRRPQQLGKRRLWVGRTVEENRFSEKWKTFSVDLGPGFSNTLKYLRFGFRYEDCISKWS